METSESNKTKLSLTGIFVQDKLDNGFTAFFAEFPEAVAEGDDQKEAEQNLFNSLITILDVKKEQQQFVGNGYTTKSFDLEIA
jgi:predicted RNase H-like HicB family nuclease